MQEKHFRKRTAILDCLRDTTTHPDAEWIYSRVKAVCPDISLATVYRNLALFKQQGLIASVGTVGGVERFDGNPAPHVHFICTGCSSVQDLPEVQPPESLCSAVSSGTGGRVDSCNLSFAGLCRSCLKNAPTEGGNNV